MRTRGILLAALLAAACSSNPYCNEVGALRCVEEDEMGGVWYPLCTLDGEAPVWGPDGVTPDGPTNGTFAICDRDGNIVCVGEGTDHDLVVGCFAAP